MQPVIIGRLTCRGEPGYSGFSRRKGYERRTCLSVRSVPLFQFFTVLLAGEDRDFDPTVELLASLIVI